MDKRKVGKDVSEAIFAPTYSTTIFYKNIHIGPSDYVPWQKDNEACFIRMQGKLFGDIPMNIELRLSVVDSPNSEGIVIEVIRFCKLAPEVDQGCILCSSSAYFMNHPPKQYTDDIAHQLTEEFISGKRKD